MNEKHGNEETSQKADDATYHGNCEEDFTKKCKICFREFDSIHMESHIEMCRKSLTCGKCKKMFDDVKSFEIHISVCVGETKYKCYVCVKNLMMKLPVVTM